MNLNKNIILVVFELESSVEISKFQIRMWRNLVQTFKQSFQSVKAETKVEADASKVLAEKLLQQIEDTKKAEEENNKMMKEALKLYNDQLTKVEKSLNAQREQVVGELIDKLASKLEKDTHGKELAAHVKGIQLKSLKDELNKTTKEYEELMNLEKKYDKMTEMLSTGNIHEFVHQYKELHGNDPNPETPYEEIEKKMTEIAHKESNNISSEAPQTFTNKPKKN